MSNNRAHKAKTCSSHRALSLMIDVQSDTGEFNSANLVALREVYADEADLLNDEND